jgi:PAS domain S-box-containing protein
MKRPKPEILFSLLFLFGEGAWIYFSYEYETPQIIERRNWLFEELLDLGIVVALAIIIYFIVRSYRLRQEQSSKEYHDLFEASPIPMWIVDADTKKFLLVNESMVEKYGYTREELYTMTTYQIRPEEEIKRLDEYLSRVQKGLQDTGVWVHRKKTGEEFYVQTRTNIFKYKGKNSIIVLADDITDIVEKEKEISRLSLVAKNTINGIIITGADRRIEWVNDAFTSMTGYTLQDVIGKYPVELLHGNGTDKKEEEQMKRSVQAGSSYSGEVLNYRKDGSELWVQTTISPLSVNGTIDKHVAIFLDINERKQQENMIQLQNEKLKEITFASSHLIRAPLSNILGLTQLLDENPALIDEIATHLKTSAEVLDGAIRQMIKQASDSEQYRS